jgi:hypothetical protein
LFPVNASSNFGEVVAGAVVDRQQLQYRFGKGDRADE